MKLWMLVAPLCQVFIAPCAGDEGAGHLCFWPVSTFVSSTLATTFKAICPSYRDQHRDFEACVILLLRASRRTRAAEHTCRGKLGLISMRLVIPWTDNTKHTTGCFCRHTLQAVSLDCQDWLAAHSRRLRYSYRRREPCAPTGLAPENPGSMSSAEAPPCDWVALQGGCRWMGKPAESGFVGIEDGTKQQQARHQLPLSAPTSTLVLPSQSIVPGPGYSIKLHPNSSHKGRAKQL